MCEKYDNMNDEERRAALRGMLEMEAGNPDQCIWMSFADAEGDGHNLGVIITVAPGPMHAVLKTKRLGINPGGEVLMHVVNPDNYDPAHFDKLLQKNDLIAFGYIEPTVAH